MYNSLPAYLNCISYKSIQDKFIDDCFCLEEQYCSYKNEDQIATGIKIQSQNSIGMRGQSQKQMGRWTIEESYIYLQVVKHHTNTKNIVKKLVQRLPKRIQSQIRAHHQKMIRKYGSIQQIIRCLDRQENYSMIEINKRLSKMCIQLQQLCEEIYF